MSVEVKAKDNLNLLRVTKRHKKAETDPSKLMTLEEIKERFIYDRDAGKLTWKIAPRRHSLVKSKEINSLDKAGYVRVMVNGKTYLVHRIIFFIEHGYWPELIDHINGNRSDNHYTNLRATTYRGNATNKAIHRTGKVPNVHLVSGSWVAKIFIGKTQLNLGTYEKQEDAISAHVGACKVVSEMENVFKRKESILKAKLEKCKEQLYKEFKSNHVGFAENHYQEADDDLKQFLKELDSIE